MRPAHQGRRRKRTPRAVSRRGHQSPRAFSCGALSVVAEQSEIRAWDTRQNHMYIVDTHFHYRFPATCTSHGHPTPQRPSSCASAGTAGLACCSSELQYSLNLAACSLNMSCKFMALSLSLRASWRIEPWGMLGLSLASVRLRYPHMPSWSMASSMHLAALWEARAAHSWAIRASLMVTVAAWPADL